MGIPPFRESMIIHTLIGVGWVVFFAVRAMRRNNDPPRWIADFGTGALGQSVKWIQWYSWAMLFEFATALFYWGTGLFYYEIGMSFIEGAVLTIGAFVTDRVIDFALGITETVPYAGAASDAAEAMKAHATAFSSHLRQTMKPSTVSEDTLKQENQKFDDITRGH